ncbi:hypothetical protein CKO31_03695 [Thiohalocapsa halophila]|uniref:Uncharacterized protein n=1 Tax=Thiohalocapsa halophila TaxID=69359 RepID=A0ABS1CD83_9GAMM|nr:hypothetical protein [Thiohalocapsa halophila]
MASAVSMVSGVILMRCPPVIGLAVIGLVAGDASRAEPGRLAHFDEGHMTAGSRLGAGRSAQPV